MVKLLYLISNRSNERETLEATLVLVLVLVLVPVSSTDLLASNIVAATVEKERRNHFKGDIFSSLENVVLVAKVNKNYLSHLGLQKSGLTVSSILKH